MILFKKVNIKCEKLGPSSGSKKHFYLIRLRCQKEKPSDVKKRFTHYTCSNLKGLGGQEKLSKIDVQMATSHQNPSPERPRLRCLRFCEVLGVGNKLATNRKCQRLWRPSGFRALYFGGVGGRGAVLGRRKRRDFENC